MIIHLDMDAFFAAVEVLDNPALSGKCLVVGGHSKRGVVAAASYEARRYGIHSAMPMFQARRLCADIVVVAPRRKRYGQISRQVMAIIRTVSPRVEQISIDEAYADVTGCERLHGPPGKMAKDLKQRIKNAAKRATRVERDSVSISEFVRRAVGKALAVSERRVVK